MQRFVSLLGCVLLCACHAGRDQLLADLQSDRAEQRALAVKKLGEAHRADDLILFTRAAHDAAAIVREEAATALGETGVADVVDVLAELAEDSQESVQVKAVQALAHFPGNRARSLLVLQYSRRGRATREAIIGALRASGGSDAPAELVAAEAKTLWNRYAHALRDGTLAEQVTAAETLGQSGRPDAVELLLPLIKDRQLPLAAAAIRGLSSSSDPRVVPACLGALSETYPELRQSAIETLRRLRPPEAAAPLLSIAREGSASSLSAIRALSELPRTPELDAGLCALSIEAEAEAAATSAEAMKRRGGCPAKVLAPALAASAPRGRALAALRAMSIWGPQVKEALPLATARLTSKDPDVLLWAARAVGATGGKEQVEPLAQMFRDGSARLAAAREDWVKEPMSPEPSPTFNPSITASPVPQGDQGPDQRKAQFQDLISRLDRFDAERRGRSVKSTGPPPEVVSDTDEAAARLVAASLEGLSALGAPEALAGVKAFASDPDPRLQEAALLAGARTGKEGVALLQKQLGSVNPERQKRLAQALWDSGDDGRQAVFEAIANAGPGRKLALLEVVEGRGAMASSVPVLEGVIRGGGVEAVLAARQLGVLKSAGSVPVLLESLRDPGNVARREVLWALGQIGDGSAASAVSKELCHESPEVRAAAAQALIRLGTAEQKPMLQALSHDYYKIVRDQAALAFAAHAGSSPGAAH